MIKQLSFAMIFALCTVTSVIGVEISWDIFKSKVLESSNRIAINKLNLDTAKQSYKASISRYLPQVEFQMVTSFNHIGSDQYKYGISYFLPVFSGFNTMYSDVKSEFVKLKLSHISLRREICDVLYEAKIIYIDLIYAYEKLELLKNIRQRRVDNRNILKLKYESGAADISFLKVADADILKADYDIRDAKRHIELVSANLYNVMGKMEYSKNIEIFEPIEKHLVAPKLVPLANYDDCIMTIPEFLTVKYALKIHKINKLKIKGQWMPNIDVFGQISDIRGSHVHYQNNTVEVQVKYKIFTGFLRQRNMKMALNNLECATKELKNTFGSLKVKAIKCYNDLVNLCEYVSININYLNALKLQSEVQSKKYINALAEYYDWYNAENNYITCQLNSLQCKRDANLKLAEWYRLIGKEL